MSEINDKLQRLREWLQREQLDGVVLTTRANFAWLTGGGDNHVVSQGDAGVAALYVSADAACLIANDIEAPRLIAEEPVAAFALSRHPWTTSLGAAIATEVHGRVVSDDPTGTGLPPVPMSFLDVRAQLGDAELDRYRRLGADCSAIIEGVARGLQPGVSEQLTEAALAGALLEHGIQPYVLLIAFDERLPRFRHPTPTTATFSRQGMLVVCGQRDGLIANLTRIVHVGALSADLRARHAAVCGVEVAMWEATRPGRSWGSIFACAQDAYAAAGFADEWQLHHQGGPTGYVGRDFLVVPGEERVVLDRQAVAWNPSITGTKTEDTFVVMGESREMITDCSSDWPTIDVTSPNGATIARPDILEL